MSELFQLFFVDKICKSFRCLFLLESKMYSEKCSIAFVMHHVLV